MLINGNALPFYIDNVVKSTAWHEATISQRRKFISAAVTFDTILTHYAEKYRAKRTFKGEFIACVLWNFYYELFETPITMPTNSQIFDDELNNYYYSDVGKHDPIDNFSDRLLDEALHPKRWIKRIKQAYRKYKTKIIDDATNENGDIDITLIQQFSKEYVGFLY